MSPTVSQLLEIASSMSPAERADLARGLLLSISEGDVDDDARLDALREAVAVAEASIAAGRGIEVPRSELREFVGKIGREATEAAAAKSA